MITRVCLFACLFVHSFVCYAVFDFSNSTLSILMEFNWRKCLVSQK